MHDHTTKSGSHIGDAVLLPKPCTIFKTPFGKPAKLPIDLQFDVCQRCHLQVLLFKL